MAEITITIPAELEEELKNISKINWQLLIVRKLKEELEEAARIKSIVSKSKLTQQDADKLADEVNEALAKRYEKLLRER